MQTSIASLQAEKDTLEEKLRENQKALSDEQNTTQSLKELLEDRNLLVENKALTYLQDTKELQTTIATLQAKIEENEQAYEMLTYQAGELENLLSEQQIINSELQTIMNENEAEHASEVASLRAAHEQRLRELQNTIESLQTDNTILTSQLEEKTQSLEERLSLEQQRMDEVKRQEEERQALQKKNAEEQRRAEEAENARLAALEAEYQQIPPPLSQLTLPRLYSTDEATKLAADNDQLNVLMLPLDDIRWSDATMAALVSTSISDIKAPPVILVTGHMQNVIDLVRKLRRNAVLVEGGGNYYFLPDYINHEPWGGECSIQQYKNHQALHRQSS